MGRHVTNKKKSSKKSNSKSSSNQRKQQAVQEENLSTDCTGSVTMCWIDRLRWVPVDKSLGRDAKSAPPAVPCDKVDAAVGSDEESNAENDNDNIQNKNDQQRHSTVEEQEDLSIITWNVLAEAYCSRRSHCNLPRLFQKHVFHHPTRRARIRHILNLLVSDSGLNVDVLCLQEVDLPEIGAYLRKCGYVGVETPRVVGGGAGGRTDACAIYVRQQQTNDDALIQRQGQWELIQHEIVRLDDLATLSSSNTQAMSTATNSKMIPEQISRTDVKIPFAGSNLQGMQQSFLRRNMGLIVRLRHLITGRTVVVANAHLYWNPGFEYVKVRRDQISMILRQREKESYF